MHDHATRREPSARFHPPSPSHPKDFRVFNFLERTPGDLVDFSSSGPMPAVSRRRREDVSVSGPTPAGTGWTCHAPVLCLLYRGEGGRTCQAPGPRPLGRAGRVTLRSYACYIAARGGGRVRLRACANWDALDVSGSGPLPAISRRGREDVSGSGPTPGRALTYHAISYHATSYHQIT